MGAVLQTAGAAELVAELTCCACSSVCGLVTKDSATRAKFRYCSFLLMATITCIILLIPGLRQKLNDIPNFCGSKFISDDTCDNFVGFSAVYRILFSMTVFHFILSVLTIRVTRVKSFRAKFNNSLWLFKMGLILCLTLTSFYIPRNSGFFRIWMYISLSGGFMFVMFQIILIIDFGHSWSLSWAEKLETGSTKIWYLAMAAVTLLMFGLSLGALVSFYTFFTHPKNILKCHANMFYITFIGIQCFLATIISITPSVQQELVGAGLLQSSVVILYTMYLTWNTLSTEPDSICNPLGNIILQYDAMTGVSGEAILGCLLTIILLLFACVVRANTSHLGKYGLALAESEDFAMATYYEDMSRDNVETKLETGAKEVSLDAYVGYNYSFFHIVLALASLHILMILTNWHSPEDNSNMQKLVKNWASVWVQMASSFVCILVYVWFLVTPLIKRVWGPIFGIIEKDNNNPINHPFPLENKCNTSDLQGQPTKIKINHNISSTQNDAGKKAPANCEKQIGSKTNRNTYDPNQTSLSIPAIIQRKASNETVSSKNTGLSITSRRRRTIQFFTVVDKENDSKSTIRQRVVTGSKKSLDRRLKRWDSTFSQTTSIKGDSHREGSVLSNTSAAPAKKIIIDNANIRKKIHKKQNKLGKKENPDIIPTRKKSQIQNRENGSPKTKGSDTDDVDTWIVSLPLSRKSQKSFLANEILKIQWKILRTQAKVVKIQERIIRLQSESTMAHIEELPINFKEKNICEKMKTEKSVILKEPG